MGNQQERYEKIMRIADVLKKNKKETIRGLGRFGRKHPVLKYVLFVGLVIYLFLYNLFLQFFMNYHLRDRLAQGLAMVMTVVMILTSMNVTAFAALNGQDPAGTVPSGRPLTISQTVGDVTITVSAPAGAFPEGTSMQATLVGTDDRVTAAVSEARDPDKNVAESNTYDITMFDGSGNEIEPDTTYGTVHVSFEKSNAPAACQDIEVYHVEEQDDRMSAEKMTTQVDEGSSDKTVTASVDTTGFSYYTVEFYYGDLAYVMDGDSSIKLSTIQKAIGLEGVVTAVRGSNDDLFSIQKDAVGGDWTVTAKKAFSTNESMTLTIDDHEYFVKMTDTIVFDGIQYSKELTGHHSAQNWNTPRNCYLSGNDYEVTDYINITGIVYLNLNNYTMKVEDGIRVRAGGTLVIVDPYSGSGSKGRIKGTNGYPAILVESGGTLEIHGGTFTENSCTDGVILNQGTMRLWNDSQNNDIVVTGNSISGTTVGGGVTNGGAAYIKGNIQVYNNTNTYWNKHYDFMQTSANQVHISGALGDRSNISCKIVSEYSGGSNSDMTGTITSGYSTYNPGKSATAFFNRSSDSNTSYGLKLSGGEVCVVSHSHSWVYTAKDNSVTAKCSNSDGVGGSCSYLKEASAGTLTISPPSNLLYSGSAKAATFTNTITSITGATAGSVNYAGINGTSYGSTTTAPTNAGTYRASVTIGAQTAYTDFTITKNTATLSVAPTGKSLTYNGSAQSLANSGTTYCGTVYYSLNNQSSWSTVVPTATGAGNYVIYYKVVGNSNYNDSSVAYVNATIAKKSLSASDTPMSFSPAASFTYDKTDKTVTVTVHDAARNLDLSSSNDYSISGTTSAKNVGSYTATITGKGNYTGTVSRTWTIAKKALIIIPDKDQKKEYGEDDPMLTYTAPDLCDGDSITGILARISGENAGTYAYTLGSLSDSNYALSLQTGAPTFKITAKGLTDDMLSLNQSTYEYTKDTYTPTLTVKDGNKSLVKDTDYTLDADSADSAADEGKYTIKVTGKGNYSGSASIGWSIGDDTPPTGSIQVGTEKSNLFNSFLNAITFGRFFKETQKVTIAASDKGSGIDSIEYLLSDTKKTEVELKDPKTEWTTLTKEDSGTFNIDPDSKVIIYGKLTDADGNYSLISSDGMVLDATAPAISGILNENGYCVDSKTFTVTDTNLDTVNVDGSDITLDQKGSYTINADNNIHTIIATDKAKNSVTYTVGVYTEHKWSDWKVTKAATESVNGTETRKCQNCGLIQTRDIPAVKKQSYTGGAAGTVHGDKGSTYTVTISSGDTPAQTLTGVPAGDTFKFSNLPDGPYNLKIQSEDPEKPYVSTKLVTIKGGEPQTDIEMTAGALMSQVVVQSGAPDVAADGLQELFDTSLYKDNTKAVNACDNGGTVEIRLETEKTTNTTVEDLIKDAVQKDDMVLGGALDLNINLYITDEEGNQTVQKITDTKELIRVIVPLTEAQLNHKNYKVYRNHDGAVTVLKELAESEYTAPTEEGFFIQDGYVNIWANKFSTYSLAYDKPEVPTQPTDNGGSGSGSSSGGSGSGTGTTSGSGSSSSGSSATGSGSSSSGGSGSGSTTTGTGSGTSFGSGSSGSGSVSSNLGTGSTSLNDSASAGTSAEVNKNSKKKSPKTGIDPTFKFFPFW
jgi:hypothetical protein